MVAFASGHTNAGRRDGDQAAPGAFGKTGSYIIAGNLLVLRTVAIHRGLRRINLSGQTSGVEPRAGGRGPLSRGRPLASSEAAVVVQITLVGERQADVGHEFVYRGPQPECKPCKVRAACLNQDL